MFEEFVQPGYDFEGVGDVKHVGFAASPTAVGIKIDGAALVDKAPADDVRLFAMTASGQAFAMAGCGARLSDLVEMGHESEDGLIFAALVDERLAAAQGSVGEPEEIEDQFFGLLVYASTGSGVKPLLHASRRWCGKQKVVPTRAFAKESDRGRDSGHGDHQAGLQEWP
jgi:hypothetical protein